MLTNSICAIDFETACNNFESACAIGMARIRNGTVTETFYSLIKPPECFEFFPLFTNTVHGISRADVENSPTFAELWAEIAEFIGDDTLVAHNATFDRLVFTKTLAYYAIEATIPRFICTVDCSRKAWAQLPNHQLPTVSNHLGIELNHHEALSDAVACAKIYLEAVKCIDI